LNIDICRFESSQKDKSIYQSADSSKAVFNRDLTFNIPHPLGKVHPDDNKNRVFLIKIFTQLKFYHVNNAIQVNSFCLRKVS